MTRTFGFGLALLILSMPGASALTSATDLSDAGSSNVAQAMRPTDGTSIWTDPAPPADVVTVSPPPQPETPPRPLSANPLWGVPIATLTATRDRPIFSPSRRPPPAAVATGIVARVAPPPKPRETERPQLALVGTIASADEGFGIFLDTTTRGALRLKVGDEYQGWKLKAVHGREAVLEKDQQSATLALPAPGDVSSAATKSPASRSIGRADR